MEEKAKPTRKQQFSPLAEKLIKARQQSPAYQKLNSYMSKAEDKSINDSNADDDKRINTFIDYLTSIFTSSA